MVNKRIQNILTSKTIVNEIEISVVIPAYNSEQTISQAIDSVVSQTSLGYIKEVIVVDDGSIDSTSQRVNKAIKKYSSKCKIILIQKENGGVSSARNYGIEKASGNWIGFLDSDDMWRASKISKQVSILNNNQNIVALGSGSNKLSPKYGLKVSDNLYKINLKEFLFRSRVSTPTILCKKSVIKEMGGFNTQMHFAEDLNLFMKIAEKYNLYTLSNNLVTIADKPLFGGSGLSSNLKEMHKGCLLNITIASENNYINLLERFCYAQWENIRYFRRILITTINKISGRN